MKGSVKSVILMLCAVMLTTAGAVGKTPQYVGAKKCKTCHNKKKEVRQFTIWKESAHARAYETLATDKAKEYATKAGIKGDPQQAGECLECHVTGHGLDSTHFARTYVVEDGVQCESCHGPGSEYKSTKIMSAKKYKADREAQHEIAVKAGLTIPDEKVCVRCHNERSPAFKGFDFKKAYEEIKHEYAR